MSVPKHQIDKDAIWQMLQFIPSHEREIWITMGMALKSELCDKSYNGVPTRVCRYWIGRENVATALKPVKFWS